MGKQRVDFYTFCIKRLLSDYVQQNTEFSKVQLLFDDERMSYIALRAGWFHQKRIHLCLIHIDIQDEQIIIQANNTEDAIATELVKMGIPRENIHLGFLPPEVRRQIEQEQPDEESHAAMLLQAA